MWLLALNKLNVGDLLQKRNRNIKKSPRLCCMCSNGDKSADQLYLYCPFSFHIRSRILKPLEWNWVMPRKCKDLMKEGFFGECDKQKQIVQPIQLFGIFGWSATKGCSKALLGRSRKCQGASTLAYSCHLSGCLSLCCDDVCQFYLNG